jgi:predicted transcriptional regulator
MLRMQDGRTEQQKRNEQKQRSSKPIAEVLKAWRKRYDLTQPLAAKWLTLPIGKFHDYEQSRSSPAPIIKAGILVKIANYEYEYENYMIGESLEKALIPTRARRHQEGK